MLQPFYFRECINYQSLLHLSFNLCKALYSMFTEILNKIRTNNDIEFIRANAFKKADKQRNIA
jgi:hypothetical protein